MESQIEVVGARPIDGAVKRYRVCGGESYRHPTPGKVAQHEAERHPSTQRRDLVALLKAFEKGFAVEGDADDCRERHDDQRAPIRLLGGEPIGTHLLHREVMRLAAEELHGDRPLACGERLETRAQLDARDAQALGLGVERSALSFPL